MVFSMVVVWLHNTNKSTSSMKFVMFINRIRYVRCVNVLSEIFNWRVHKLPSVGY